MEATKGTGHSYIVFLVIFVASRFVIFVAQTGVRTRTVGPTREQEVLLTSGFVGRLSKPLRRQALAHALTIRE